MKRLMAVIVTLLAAAATACGTAALRTGTASSPPVPPGAPARVLPPRVTGIVSNSLAAFDANCGCRPGMAVHYVRWGEDPSTSRKLAQAMSVDGASPLLEISPYGTTLAAVTAGRGDAWLLSYARMVHSLNMQVMLSFAPEANGYWYSWGWPHAKPADEAAAWRHVVTVFRKAGVTNARWVWIINQLWPRSGPLPELWPGAAYVNEVGIDGYFRATADTFATVFAPTVTAVRSFAPGSPVLITETGASPQAGKARAVRELASGVFRYGLAGFVWFDINQSGQSGLDKADWSLDDPAALAAFRAEAGKSR